MNDGAFSGASCLGRTAPTVFVSTGSTSSDLLVEPLLYELRARGALGNVLGIGGPRLREFGASLFFDATSLSGVGIGAVAATVVTKLGEVWSAYRRIEDFFRTTPPDLVILVDNPGINLRLLRLAHRHGVPTLYYVPPELWGVWNWEAKALARMARSVATLVPSETQAYRRLGANVRWIGHPLVDLLGDTPRVPEQVGSAPRIGLFPGSRMHEVVELLPILGRAAELIKLQEPGATFEVCVANDVVAKVIARQVRSWTTPVKLVQEQSHAVMGRCDLLLTCSGTATLEAAILGLPMVVLYRVRHWLDRLLGYAIWWRGGFPRFSFPNVLLDRDVVPELLQGEVTAEKVAGEALRLLRDEDRRRTVLAGLAEVRHLVGPPGAVRRAADLVEEMLGRSPEGQPPVAPLPLEVGAGHER